jgi:putative addiction module killer protein
MFDVLETAQFREWINGLKDSRARVRIGMRIERVEQGNFGDHKNLGDISELRIDHGPGYRVYYMSEREQIIILLAGGDKSTQGQDIATARFIAKDVRDRRSDRDEGTASM